MYLPAILLISVVWGLRLGLFASVLSAVAFNFFQIPPLHRFTIAEEQNWVALAAFAIAAIVSSTVAGLARARALEAERRREEADRALAKLEALTRERDRMQAEAVEAEALRRSDELKTALLRSISHDLRTPLTSIIAGGSALGSGTLTAEERAELSAAIVGEGNRLSRLVDGNIVVRVVDQGPGIPESEWERIFEPFQRGDSANTGTGLGLAIAKGFVEANGGEIGIESLPGQGSSFVVTLPSQTGASA